MKKTDALGKRMKDYEYVTRTYLTKRTPVIVRIDGRAFHTFTKGFVRPFDKPFMKAMQLTAQKLCENISGCRLAYIQSDEISLLLTDDVNEDTQPWFDNNLQKIVSVSASLATLYFNKFFKELTENLAEDDIITQKLLTTYASAVAKGATFDSRAFLLPKGEVVNYFIWRQIDASRNSILSISQSLFSAQEIHGKSLDNLQELMFSQRGVNWNDYIPTEKRGSCVVHKPYEKNGAMRMRWEIDNQIPVFTKDLEYIEKLL